MDRNKFSSIAHSKHLFSNPISETKINRIIDFLQLEPHAKLLDIGAGKCELLIRLVEKYDIEATAVELYEGSILEAKQQAQKRIPEEKITYIVKDAKQVVSEYVNHFDVGICVGSTHALGSLELTLQSLKRNVKKGGFILVGEGYWKKKPSQAYLEALGGADESELKNTMRMFLWEKVWGSCRFGQLLQVTMIGMNMKDYMLCLWKNIVMKTRTTLIVTVC
ncbi:methyltransferase domain-containing protein [Priestia sp. OVL9]|nr:methyltransferase domain-containing protein [Priestia sp. OVL9]